MLVGTIVFAVALAVVGVLALLIGFRGRRIDDHPLCRKCRFDLSGAMAAGSRLSVCPECGRSVADRADRRVGNRKRRRGSLIFGGSMLIVALLIGSTLVYAQTRGINWQKHKPLAYLRYEAAGNGATNSLAFQEVTRRLQANRLERADLSWWIDRALSLQGDHNQPWEPAWGDFIEACRKRELIAEEEWKRYAAQALVFALRPRSPVGLGDEVPFDIEYNCRLGGGNHFRLELIVAPPVIDGEPPATYFTKRAAGFDQSWVGARMHATNQYLHWYKRGPARVAVEIEDDGPREAVNRLAYTEPQVTHRTGRLEMNVPIRVAIHENSPNFKPNQVGLVEFRRELSGAFECVPRGQLPAIELITKPEWKQHLQGFTLQSLQRHGGAAPGYMLPVAMVYFGHVPVDFAYDAYLRVDGHEHHIGRRCHEMQPLGGGIGFSRPLKEFEIPDGAKLDVILRPSPAAARSHPTITRIWGEEIVFENVAIK